MKMNRILTLTLIILIIILLSIISFLGIYVQDKNKMVDNVKEYQFGMDLTGSRQIELKVSTDTKTINYDADGNVIDSSDTETEVANTENKAVNSEEVLTASNYEQAKKILQDRFKTMEVNCYEIRLNKDNGNIIVNIPENDDTDLIVSQMQYQGRFEIVDNDTNEVLMTNDDIKTAQAGYGTTSSGTTSIFLNIEFNKDGKEKFRNITNQYVQTKTTDEETGEEKTTERKIALKIDDDTLLTTYFNEEVSNGILQLSVGSSYNSTEDLQSSLLQANNLAAILNAGKMQVVYEINSNTYVASEITSDNIELFITLAIIALTIAIVYLIIKYKEKGILVSISLIGYLALLLIVLRYTNVIITTSGLIAIILSVVLDYMISLKILKNIEEALYDSMKKFALTLIPLTIIAIVFSFNSWITISSFGMIMFWGIIVNMIYNFGITRILLITAED